MTPQTNDPRSQENRRRCLYAFLLVVGLLLLVGATVWRYWLHRREEASALEAETTHRDYEGQSNRLPMAIKASVEDTSKTDSETANTPGADVDDVSSGTHGKAMSPTPVDSEKQPGEIFDIHAVEHAQKEEEEAVEPPMSDDEEKESREILDRFAAERTQEDDEEPWRRKEHYRNLKRIGDFIIKVRNALYDEEETLSPSEYEDLVRKAFYKRLFPDRDPQEYTFVKDLPADAYKTMPPNTIIVYESQPESPERRMVLFLDGSVSELAEADFQKRIKEQGKTLKSQQK